MKSTKNMQKIKTWDETVTLQEEHNVTKMAQNIWEKLNNLISIK